MIAFLNGILREKQPDRAIMDIGGVGFDVSIPLSTYTALPDMGETVLIHTILIMREDGVRLFGFATREERGLFEIVVQVPGVGLKMAIDILSTYPPEKFSRAIQSGDSASLCLIPGIGKKRAERLVFDLKNNDALIALGASKTATTMERPSGVIGEGIAEEATQALIALGCKPTIAHHAVTVALDAVGEDVSVETLIKEALKHR